MDTQSQEKKEGFYLKDLNLPWMSVLHLANKQVIPKLFVWDKPCAETFSFLEKGSVRLECLSVSGKQRILLCMQSGCLFRENTLLPSGFKHAFKIVALEECVVHNFPAKILSDEKFIQSHPALISNFILSLNQKLDFLFARVADTNEQLIDKTVCFYIDKLVEQYDTCVFAPKISQSDFATAIGIHRSTLGRILKELREEGIIGTFSYKKLEIFDREKLKKYATLY